MSHFRNRGILYDNKVIPEKNVTDEFYEKALQGLTPNMTELWKIQDCSLQSELDSVS